MAGHKKLTPTTVAEFRAKATSMRTMSLHAHNPVSKARMLAMALDLDGKADALATH